MQTEDDARRLRQLGVPEQRLTVTGNLKFETAPPDPLPELEERLRELAAQRPILVAGSTMEGEDQLLLEAPRDLDAGIEHHDATLLPESPRELQVLENRKPREAAEPGERLAPYEEGLIREVHCAR